MSELFRFGIMGAGKIASKFCNAVLEHGGAKVVAVASRSIEKAKEFAQNNNIENAYDSYEEMLKNEKLDAVYIAVTTNAHYELTMLCINYGVPVLCEKPLSQNSKEATEVFELAKERGVFVMEAMWTRFFPKLKKATEWINDGRIGDITLMTCSLGFQAAKDPENRLYSPQLGGGVAYDLLVYCYEVTRYFFDEPPTDIQYLIDYAETGVDKTNVVMLKYPKCTVLLTATLEGKITEDLTICGTEGRIVMPRPHMSQECQLYSKISDDESFCSTDVENGFVYEIDEVIKCVRGGKKESLIVPHSLTMETAVLYDKMLFQSDK